MSQPFFALVGFVLLGLALVPIHRFATAGGILHAAHALAVTTTAAIMFYLEGRVNLL